jgi:hypothetical protein
LIFDRSRHLICVEEFRNLIPLSELPT